MSLFKHFIKIKPSLYRLSPLNIYYSTGYHDNKYPLPWPHYSSKETTFQSDPLLHKMAGLFLLKRIVKASGYKFTISDFMSGVKDAITSFNKLLFSDNTTLLKDIITTNLYEPLSLSLSTLTCKPHLQLESINNLSLIRVRSIVGVAPPDDRHVISYMGQKLITSQSRMESIMYSNGRVTIHSAKELGEEATAAKMEFLLTVSFNTKECYYITDNDGTIVGGANELRNSAHIWTFGSVVHWDYDYPLEWKIYDINNYILTDKDQ